MSKKLSTRAEFRKQGISDLHRSGLTLKDVAGRVLTPKALVEILNRTMDRMKRGFDPGFGAIYLPYHDINGVEIKDHAAVRMLATKAQLERAALPRYLAFNPEADFSDDKDFKFGPPRFYLPLTLKDGWKTIAADPQYVIFITEGAKKAGCACKCGFPTIGLEGVWNFVRKNPDDARKKSIPLADFDLINWVGRVVVVCYDSDISFRPQVQQAARQLAVLLEKLGARPAYVQLSCDCSPPCKGIDDYLVKHGASEFGNLPRREFSAIDQVAARFVKLAKPAASVYDRELRLLLPHKNFWSMRLATRLLIRTASRSPPRKSGRRILIRLPA